MRHPLGEIVLLVPERDPAAPEQVEELQQALRRNDLDHRVVPLGADPAAAVRREVKEGSRYLVHCGGQASFVSWLPACFDGDTWAPADLVVGVFPGGASNDFARTFGLVMAPKASAALLAGPRVMPVDVGVATLPSDRKVLVFNEAVVGLGAAVAKRNPRSRVGRLLAWWGAIARHRTVAVDVDMTFAEWHAPAVEVRLANGQFAHDALLVAPLANPDDGAWDVQVWDGPAHLPFSLQPKMVRGDHLPHEHVAQWRQKRVAVSAGKPLPVAVDGRYVGTTPATFTLLPKALRLKI